MLIQIDNPSEYTFNYMLHQIKLIFPRCQTDFYENFILVLLPTKQHGVFPTIPTETLEEFLKNNSAWAGISFPVKSPLSLPAVYKEALDAIKLGKKFTKDSSHIFYYENYFLYSIIDMYNNDDFKRYYNQNLGYLCHPAYVQLHRYDLAKNDNLSELLFRYLMNNQNISKTSEELFLHRNTIVKKIQKITEIIHRPLDDALLCQALLFSFQVAHFSKTVLGKDIEYLDK